MILAAASCKSPQQVTVNSAGAVSTTTASQTDAAIHKVIFGNWTVADVGGMKVTGPDRPYLEFGADATNPFLAKCYVYDGCNYINGEYAITPGGSMKRTSEFASTMRMCADAPYEMGVTLAVNNVTNYRIEKAGTDYLLYLTDAEGKTLMTLRRYDASFIDGAWAVTDVEGRKIKEDSGVTLAFDLKDLSIHGNAGCNVLNGRIVMNPDVQNAISFTNVATTRMTCPEIELEQQVLGALNRVAAISAVDDDTANLLDSAGQTLMTLKRIKQ